MPFSFTLKHGQGSQASEHLKSNVRYSVVVGEVTVGWYATTDALFALLKNAGILKRCGALLGPILTSRWVPTSLRGERFISGTVCAKNATPRP